MVITFKFTENKSPVALTNELVRCVVGASPKEVKSQVHSKTEQAFYKNISNNQVEFGTGTYFAIKTETGYVFAFVSADRSTASIKFRESKNTAFKIVTYKLVMSAKNHDCYVVNTKINEVVENEDVAQPETEIKEIETIETNETDLVLMVARLKAQLAAKDNEITELKSEIEVKDTKIKILENDNKQLAEIATVSDRKRRRSFRSYRKARNEMSLMRKVKAAGHDVSAYYLNKESNERALDMMAGGF